MLSENEKQVKELIKAKLTGTNQEEARLFHISVERKLEAVRLWFQNVEALLPYFAPATDTFSTGVHSETKEPISLEPTLIDTINTMSAYIDAFFMSAKSTLDTFAHEVRNLYGLDNHSGDLYFENAIDLLKRHHSGSELDFYIEAIDIKNSIWFSDLKLYRKASTHESIIQIKPSVDLDFLSGEWKNIILKLPIDPTQRPLAYNGKNFINTGKEIIDELTKFIIESYNKILNDINNGNTKIIL